MKCRTAIRVLIEGTGGDTYTRRCQLDEGHDEPHRARWFGEGATFTWTDSHPGSYQVSDT